MTADSGKSGTALITRCLQVLQLAMGIVSAVQQSALFVVKSTYQMLRPQRAKSLAGEIVLVCIIMQLIVGSAELETARATLQGGVTCAKNKRVLVRVHTYFTDFGACAEQQLHGYQFAYPEITFPLIW